MSNTASQKFIRALGLSDATLLVIGCIVGVGIFRMSGAIAQHLQSPLLILGLWLAGGVISLCGALCYAELAAMFPRSGGDYIYVTRIFGPLWGFLFGWTKLFVERTGTIAILGFVFAEYLTGTLGLTSTLSRWLACVAVLLLTTVNVLGIRWGTRVQNVMTAIKLAALGVIILAGVLLQRGQPGLWYAHTGPADLSVWKAFGVALVFVLWAYGGWTEAAYVAEEIREPQRNVPRAILGGLALTTLLYLAVNAVYLWYVPPAEMAHSPLVAARMMERALGHGGAVFIAVMIACSAFGALNGYILTGARILYAMGQDHPLFTRLGTLHARFRTPALALWCNAALAIMLIFTRTLDQIATYSTVAISVFFTATVLGVMILRQTQPKHPRPYRTWGYPIPPLVFMLAMAIFILDVCIQQPSEALFGFGWMSVGFPLYWLSQRLRTSTSRAP